MKHTAELVTPLLLVAGDGRFGTYLTPDFARARHLPVGVSVP
ncbi:MAG: hypothetical protein AAGA95_13155 [Pseudomonadota bacterium]